MCTGIAAPRQCHQPAWGMVLPVERGRGLPSRRGPRGVYNPALTRGRHGGLWEVYPGTREPTQDSQGPTLRRVAPDSRPLSVVRSCKVVKMQMLYVLRSRPSSKLSRRWYARSRCRGQGQEVSAGEPVRAPESRCSGFPLLTRKRIAWEKREPTVPPAVVLRRFLQVSARRDTYCHYDCWSATGRSTRR